MPKNLLSVHSALSQALSKAHYLVLIDVGDETEENLVGEFEVYIDEEESQIVLSPFNREGAAGGDA
jgi:hypothetical protein